MGESEDSITCDFLRDRGRICLLIAAVRAMCMVCLRVMFGKLESCFCLSSLGGFEVRAFGRVGEACGLKCFGVVGSSGAPKAPTDGRVVSVDKYR